MRLISVRFGGEDISNIYYVYIYILMFPIMRYSDC